MPALLNDLRFGLRMLRKDIGATTLSVLSIGLGIGAATAIFSVANAVLFEPFPYKGVDRIVSFQIHPLKEGAKRFSFSISDYLKIQQESRVFEDTFAMGFEPLRLTGGSEPELIWGKLFGPNAFDFLGVRPLLGRTFLPEDYGSGGAPKRVAVLSYLLWQRRFGGDHGVLGREVLLNGKSHTVIGVMPPRFTIYTAPGQMAIWLPLALDRSQERLVTILGRLAPGVSEETASKELHAIFSRVAQVNPDHFPDQGFTVAIFRFTRFVRDWIRNTVFILLAATGLLLLIACSNVANLLLVRASARTREMAVRLSVGALRRNLLSQLLSESLMLSLTGGALGVALAYWEQRVHPVNGEVPPVKGRPWKLPHYANRGKTSSSGGELASARSCFSTVRTALGKLRITGLLARFDVARSFPQFPRPLLLQPTIWTSERGADLDPEVPTTSPPPHLPDDPNKGPSGSAATSRSPERNDRSRQRPGLGVFTCHLGFNRDPVWIGARNSCFTA